MENALLVHKQNVYTCSYIHKLYNWGRVFAWGFAISRTIHEHWSTGP